VSKKEPPHPFWKKKKEDDPDKGLFDPNTLFRPPNKGQFRFSIWYFVAALLFMIAVNSYFTQPAETTVDYSRFKELIASGQIKRVEIAPDIYIGYSQTSEQMNAAKSSGGTPPNVERYRTTPVNDPGFIPLLEKNNVEYFAIPTRNQPIVAFLLNWIVPFVFLFILWRVLFKRMGNLGPDVMSFGKNKTHIISETDTGVRFADVAGVDESKAELEEVVDFLKNPDRYTAIGGKIPKGVLLIGVPGTGKTLLAKAVAGEAGVPFFRMSGADFVEMFVGVGASRVRDLFRQAREKSPCIIFIDELDAIAKSRVNMVGGNDEREQTLNQLLVEMDGFDARTGVIILGATNRPEILDPAITRPGRFDRQVLVDRPDLPGRLAILKIHSSEVALDPSVDLEKVARQTPGLVGADLANIVNEAALMAVRAGRTRVLQEDFTESIEKVLAGLKKRNRLINDQERRRVAYHETGHAVVAHFTAGADPVDRISIVPRGMAALGYTVQLPTEERFLLTEKELLARIDVLLGGRAAEKMVFDDVSTGASDDLTKASDIVRRMITEYGMSEKFRNVYLPARKQSPYLSADGAGGGREYSESTQQYVDEESARIIAERFSAVLLLLNEHRDVVEQIAQSLLEKEIIDVAEFNRIAVSKEEAT